jgi:hypothetical protein
MGRWFHGSTDSTMARSMAIAGPERLILRTPAALHGADLKAVGEFTVETGQS